MVQLRVQETTRTRRQGGRVLVLMRGRGAGIYRIQVTRDDVCGCNTARGRVRQAGAGVRLVAPQLYRRPSEQVVVGEISSDAEGALSPQQAEGALCRACQD